MDARRSGLARGSSSRVSVRPGETTRVPEIVLRPGAIVTPESVILVLANPDVEQAAQNADSQLQAAEVLPLARTAGVVHPETEKALKDYLKLAP